MNFSSEVMMALSWKDARLVLPRSLVAVELLLAQSHEVILGMWDRQNETWWALDGTFRHLLRTDVEAWREARDRE